MSLTYPESVFRAYDIRGLIGQEITPEFMGQLGRAFVAAFDVKQVVVGYDARPSSRDFAPHFCDGVRNQGADVFNIGLVPNEVAVNAAAAQGIEHAAYITASHNPAQYVGIKLYTDTSVQIAAVNYQSRLKEAIKTNEFARANRGEERSFDPWPAYEKKIAAELGDTMLSPRHILVDAGNGVGGLIIGHLAKKLNLTYDGLYLEPDGTYPHHVPNPILPAARRDAAAQAQSGRYDLTILFDGDADRICFLDESGRWVLSDIIGTLIADEVIHPQYPDAAIVIDERRGWITESSAKRLGYTVIRAQSGNPYLKKAMREHNGAYGFESSAHNIYRDYFYSDSAGMTLISVLKVLQRQQKPLSAVVKPYLDLGIVQIDETNFIHPNPTQAVEAAKLAFADGKIATTDGLTIAYPDWHMSLRPSNTEPLLRLNLEARSSQRLQEQFEAIKKVIVDSGGQLTED